MIDQLLNIYWLRPETALWRSIDIKIMEDFIFQSPSLDIGCGDGIFSFIRGGGEFANDFDAFQSMGSLDKYFDKVDVFDSWDTEIHPRITKAPDYLIDYGSDHKENLLKKAKTLNIYKNLLLGDANQKLPFEKNSFNSIFSNIIYWLEDPQLAFREICRILKPGGQCCVMLPNSTFHGFSFYHNLYVTRKQEQFAFLEALDRGRMSKIKHAKSTDEWTRIIENAGLKIVQHKMHLSKTIIQIWDIGMRPLFPVLHKMISHLEAETLLENKKEWIQTIKMFSGPIAVMENQLNQGEEPAFHCFILEK